MNQLFGTASPVPLAAGDQVYPLHFFENSLLVQGNNMAVSIVFDEVLDPDMLRDSLEKLVKQPGWERLGGRLRKNGLGVIEWHIPTEFTEQRPAINYSYVDHGILAEAHSAASKIPRPSSKPAIVADPDELESLAWEPGYKPNGIKDYLTVDKPVLGLRVNGFTDKTVVVLQWQHVAFDALGMQYVVEGWAAILSGKPAPTPCSYKKDPFEALAKGTRPASEQHVLLENRVGLAGMLRWGLGYGADMLIRAKENRMVCIPKSWWQVQLEQALKDLRAEAEKKNQDMSNIFLTENDIITAFIVRSVVASMEMNPTRTVAVSIAMSLRKAFEGDLIPEANAQPYIGNAFGWSNVLAKAGDITLQPLSWLARKVRCAINEQGTRAQHEAYYSMVRTSGMGLPIIVFGDGSMAQIGLSNWTKAGLFNIDFSAARKGSADNSSPCRPSYVQENHGPVQPCDGFFILGKDCGGNYWTSACKVKGQWAKLQEYLNRTCK